MMRTVSPWSLPIAWTRPSRAVTFTLLALLCLAMARIAWIGDDAFITFRTVQNFVHGDGLTWNIDERVQTYTHPLWLFAMSAAYAISGEMFFTAMALSLLAASSAVYIVLRRIVPEPHRAVLFVALFALSAAVMDYTSSGLENALSYLLVAAFVVVWQRDETQEKPAFPLFFLAALALLNRLDLTVLLAPAVVAWFFRFPFPRALRAALLGFAPLLAWEIFSLIYYGFLFPNTYYAKLETGISRAEYWQQGAIYLLDLLSYDAATLAILVLGAARGFLRRESRPLALGLVLYVLYVLSVGGDFMQGRFFAVPAFLALILLVQRGDERGAHTWPWLATAGLIVALIAWPQHGACEAELKAGGLPWRPSGVADERRVWTNAGSALSAARRDQRMPEDEPWTRQVLAQVEATPDHSVVMLASSIGFAGYLLGPSVHVIDAPALADPLLARLPVATSPPWRIGHFLRAVPPGYLETLRSGRNQIADAGLAALYEKLALITRGPLWSGERWRAIVALNAGGYHDLLKGYLAAQSVSLAALQAPKSEHAAWNAEGVLPFGDNGVSIDLGGPRHDAVWSLSLDNNDDYRCEFVYGKESLGDVDLAHRSIGAGLHVQRLDVPARIAAHGYDHVRLRPLRGDGAYAIGHFIAQPP